MGANYRIGPSTRVACAVLFKHDLGDEIDWRILRARYAPRDVSIIYVSTWWVPRMLSARFSMHSRACTDQGHTLFS